MPRDYRSAVDAQSLQDFSAGRTRDLADRRRALDQQSSENDKDRQAKLQQMLTGGQMEQQKEEASFGRGKQFLDENAKMGRNVTYSGGGVHLGQAEKDPSLQLNKAANQEGNILRNEATKAYDPINKSAQSIRDTLDSLDQNSPTGDSAAVMNEIKAISGSPRGVASLYQVFGGKPTANTNTGKMMDYINNTAQQGLSPAQRDNMREFAYSRTPALKQQHQSITDMQLKTAPSYARQMAATGQLEPAIQAFGSPAKQALDEVDQRYMAYKKAKGSLQTNQPGAYSPQPSNLDRLKSMFGMGGSQPAPQSSPAPAQGGFDPDAYLKGK